MVDAARARKLAVRIREIVAENLRTQVKDPRLGMVTVTDVKLTADLHDATVFYTVYGDEADRAASAAALESARGVLRSLVGRQTGVRFTPTLAFSLDEVPTTVKAIDDLIEVARKADAEVQRQAVGASYAGEADPYRPEAADEDDEDDERPSETPTDPTDPTDPAGPTDPADLAGRSGR